MSGMFKWFVVADKGADLLMRWAAVLMGLGAAYSWLTKHATFFGTLNWPDAILIGLGLGLLTLLVLAAVLGAVRYFRPLSIAGAPVAKTASAPEYRDTRLRLKQDPSRSGHLLQVTCVNIHSWQQTVGIISTDDGKGNVQRHQHDTLVIAFEGPLSHSRPMIESFGHKLPMYNYFPLGDRAAIFQFSADEMPQTFEIWFPPPDHYERNPAPVEELPVAEVQEGERNRQERTFSQKEQDRIKDLFLELRPLVRGRWREITTELGWLGNAPQKFAGQNYFALLPGTLARCNETADEIDAVRQAHEHILEEVGLYLGNPAARARSLGYFVGELMKDITPLGDGGNLSADAINVFYKLAQPVQTAKGEYDRELALIEQRMNEVREKLT